MSTVEKSTEEGSIVHSTDDVLPNGGEVNISGHVLVPVLEKKFNLLSACATGITTGNTWTALGGAIVRIHCYSFVIRPPTHNQGRFPV